MDAPRARIRPIPAAWARAIPVGWRVATDSPMRTSSRAASRGARRACLLGPRRGGGLRPGRDYFYQFDAAQRREPDRPLPHGAVARTRCRASCRFAFATCQDWPSGYYTAYRDMLSNDLDLVLHLGDYTYEYAIGSTPAAAVLPEGFERETVDLRTYRLRHTLYKLDPDLQAAHANFRSR